MIAILIPNTGSMPTNLSKNILDRKDMHGIIVIIMTYQAVIYIYEL